MSSINEIYHILKEIYFIIEKDGEKNWINGIRTSIDLCEAFFEKSNTEKNTIDAIKSIIKTMYGGSGSFTDYIVWDDDVDTRNMLNEKFDKLTNDLWNKLELR